MVSSGHNQQYLVMSGRNRDILLFGHNQFYLTLPERERFHLVGPGRRGFNQALVLDENYVEFV